MSSIANAGDFMRQLTGAKFGRRHTDYRKKLKESDPGRLRSDQLETLAEELPQTTDKLRDLAGHDATEGAAFQSVIVAILQVLDRVRDSEYKATACAMSLAQRERLGTMTESLQETASALRSMLSVPGRKMFACHAGESAPAEEEKSWWFAISEAMETVEQGIETIVSIVARQAKGGVERDLASIVVRLLRRHQHVLHVEVDQWIG